MLKHGILGLLNYGDMTGYEISETFKNSLNYFWPAQTSQIYRELNTLEARGWITKRVVEQSSKPNKNVCSITDDGRKELYSWLTNSEIDIDMRSSILMRVFFMGNLSINESKQYFEHLNEQYKNVSNYLQKTDEAINSYEQVISDKKSSLFWQMTSDFGKRYAQLYIDWSRNCLNLLSELEEEQ